MASLQATCSDGSENVARSERSEVCCIDSDQLRANSYHVVFLGISRLDRECGMSVPNEEAAMMSLKQFVGIGNLSSVLEMSSTRL